MSSNMTTDDRKPPNRFPIFELGFRPFYLVAALFAAMALPVWLSNVFGVFQFSGYLKGVDWHSHEMVFGFTSAVIAGFMLTAVRNWTSLPTPVGGALAAMTGLWLLARLLLLSDVTVVAVVIDLAFLPVLGWAIAIPIWRSRNLRNLKLLLVLAGLTLANALYHFAHLGLIPAEWARVSITLALDLITILMAIVGGRVIPVFTGNAVPSAQPVRHASVEVISVGALVLIVLLDMMAPWITVAQPVWLIVLITAALAHTVRWLLWKPHCTMGNALLWMLPAAYAWIPIALAVRALSLLAVTPSAASVHALTLGAVGALMMAMMMRSTLGHTGRPLQAGAAEVLAFLLVQLAAVVRVMGLLVDTDLYRSTVMVSGVLWSLGFLVFVLRYGPMLIQPRVDARTG